MQCNMFVMNNLTDMQVNMTHCMFIMQCLTDMQVNLTCMLPNTLTRDAKSIPNRMKDICNALLASVEIGRRA